MFSEEIEGSDMLKVSSIGTEDKVLAKMDRSPALDQSGMSFMFFGRCTFW